MVILGTAIKINTKPPIIAATILCQIAFIFSAYEKSVFIITVTRAIIPAIIAPNPRYAPLEPVTKTAREQMINTARFVINRFLLFLTRQINPAPMMYGNPATR